MDDVILRIHVTYSDSAQQINAQQNKIDYFQREKNVFVLQFSSVLFCFSPGTLVLIK